MTHLQEVATDDLLSFHDYPTVHSPSNNTTSGFSSGSNITSNYPGENLAKLETGAGGDSSGETGDGSSGKDIFVHEALRKITD